MQWAWPENILVKNQVEVGNIVPKITHSYSSHWKYQKDSGEIKYLAAFNLRGFISSYSFIYIFVKTLSEEGYLRILKFIATLIAKFTSHTPINQKEDLQKFTSITIMITISGFSQLLSHTSWVVTPSLPLFSRYFYQNWWTSSPGPISQIC